jgi:hypothetical protein
MTAVDVLRSCEPPAGETPMMGRLRSTMQTPGATAVLIGALFLAGLNASHAAPSNGSGTDDIGRLPCNDLCKAYLAWSDRASAMFHPSSPAAQTAVHPVKPAGRMLPHPASRTRPPSLDSFAQFPVPGDTPPESAATSQAEIAPSRPAERIGDRFPVAGGIVAATPASTGSATNDAPESTVVSAIGAIPATQGARAIGNTGGVLNMRFAMFLSLALCTLWALVFRGWFRGRTQTAHASRRRPIEPLPQPPPWRMPTEGGGHRRDDLRARVRRAELDTPGVSDHGLEKAASADTGGRREHSDGEFWRASSVPMLRTPYDSKV